MQFSYAPPFRRDRADMISLRAATDRDYLARHFATRRSFYELDLLEFIAVNAPHGGLYIDVGANIGNHSVYFAKYLATHVLAIEPSPRLISVLDGNMAANGLHAYTAMKCALGSSRGTGAIIDGGDMNPGRTRIAVGKPVDPLASATEILTLDDVTSTFGARHRLPVRFLKIDVEGAELSVLQGAVNVLQQYKPHIAVELATKRERDRTIAFLRRCGYHVIGQFCHTPTFYFACDGRHRLRRIVASDAFKLEKQLEQLTPPGATIILADQCEFGLEHMQDRQLLPFLEKDGVYAGLPATTDHAISELNRMRDRGAEYLVFAKPSFWWLNYYSGFRQYLDSEFERISATSRVLAYKLGKYSQTTNRLRSYL